MSTLTPEGRRLVRSLAERHGFSEEAVTRMLVAVVAGRGRMAQFSHPEFGGNGQWMSGGMLMIGDMFDHALKARVGALCADLADASGADALLAESARSGTRNPDGEGARSPSGSHSSAMSSADSWWPRELGTPSASGSQNGMRYAYFADAARLAIERGGKVLVHDTLDHRISGFSQQQGTDGGVSMSSQHGTIDLTTLPIVSGGERTERTPEAPSSGARAGEGPSASSDRPAGTSASSASDAPVRSGEDAVQLIERLGELRERGLLTDEEFASKKRELLSRL